MVSWKPSRRTVLRSMGGAGVLGLGGRAIQRTRAQQASDESWPRPRYDAGMSGYAPENSVPVGDVEVAWTAEIESWREFHPVIDSGTWFRTSPDGEVIAVSMADGTEQWWVEFDADSVSVLCALDDTVYVRSTTGTDSPDSTLHALSATDGTEQWHRSGSATSIVDGVAYRTTDGLAALAVADGRGRWRSRGQFSTVSVSDETVFAVGVRDQETHPSQYDETVFAFSASNGTQRWEFHPDGNEISTPVVSDDTVYFETSASLVYAVSASDGTVRWKTVASTGTAPVVTDDTVYVVNSESLSALSTNDGSEQWRYTAELTSSPIVVGDTVFVGSADGLYALAADDGSERWHFETQWPVKQSPAVVDGTVLFVTREPRPEQGGTVHALSGTESETPTTTATPSPTPTTANPTVQSTTPPHTPTQSDGTESPTITATPSSPARDPSTTDDTETATTGEDGAGFGVLATLAGLGVGGWRVLANSDDTDR